MGRYSAALNMPRITDTITVTADNTTIRRKRIIVQDDGVLLNGFDNFTLDQCIIKYNYRKNAGACRGLYALYANGVNVIDCEVENMGAPERGALPSTGQSCLSFEACTDIYYRRNTLRRGSTGVQIAGCTNSDGDGLEGHDMRGPYPRGQVLQISNSFGVHNWTNLSDESIPGTSWNEDSFNIYNTPNVTLNGICIPMQSDGLSGRGLVLEGLLTVNCSVLNMEAYYTFNGLAGGFEVNSPNSIQAKSKYYNLYSARALPGSSNTGSTQCALCVTFFNPTPGVYTTVNFLYFGMPTRTPNGTAMDAGKRNTWYNPTDTGGIAQGTGTVTESDWTPAQSVVRNPLPWRPRKSKPSRDLPPRVNSNWHDGRISTTPIPGTTVLALLPGRYKHDPTSRAWQWRKNGVPISGETGINYLTQVGDVGWFDCAETPSNDNGAGPTVISSAIYVA